MKILILYDSLYGNTRDIAEAIGKGLGANHDIRMLRAQDAITEDIGGIDLFLVGSPTHGGWFTEPIKTFVANLPEGSLEGTCVVSFDTSTLTDNKGFVVGALSRLFGNAAPRISGELKKKGADCVGSEIFYVAGKQGPLYRGEYERARVWGGKLAKQVLKKQSI